MVKDMYVGELFADKTLSDKMLNIVRENLFP